MNERQLIEQYGYVISDEVSRICGDRKGVLISKIDTALACCGLVYDWKHSYEGVDEFIDREFIDNHIGQTAHEVIAILLVEMRMVDGHETEVYELIYKRKI